MTARFAAGLEAAPTIKLAGWTRASRQEAFQLKLDSHFIVKKQVEVTIDEKELTIIPGSLRIGAPPSQPVQQSVHVFSKEFYQELALIKERDFASLEIIGFPDVRDAGDGYCNNTNRYYKSFKEPCPYCGNYHHAPK